MNSDDMVTLTLVTTPGCHFCEDALSVLTALAAAESRVRLVVIDGLSSDGRTLVAAHRPALNPLVLLDGCFFSAGRLPRRKLEAALDARWRRTPAGALHG